MENRCPLSESRARSQTLAKMWTGCVKVTRTGIARGVTDKQKLLSAVITFALCSRGSVDLLDAYLLGSDAVLFVLQEVEL